MKFDEQELHKKQERLTSKRMKIKNRYKQVIHMSLGILMAALLLVSVNHGVKSMRKWLKTVPGVKQEQLIENTGSTEIYDSARKHMVSVKMNTTKREFTPLSKIPNSIKNAFLSMEDARFYEHAGVDVRSMFRVLYTDFYAENMKDNASTITQQLLDNQLCFKKPQGTISEKLEMGMLQRVMALQLDNDLGKARVLEYYLNTICLGEGIIGVGDASHFYFGKKTEDINNSEAAVLASIVENPDLYNPITNQTNNSERRKLVLKSMLEQGSISEETYEDALGDDVYSRVKQTPNLELDCKTGNYYADAVLETVFKDLQEQLGYSYTEAYNMLYRKGLKIYSNQNTKIQSLCEEIINQNQYYKKKTKSYLSYHLDIMDKNGIEIEYTEKDMKRYFQNLGQEISLYVYEKQELASNISEFRSKKLLDGETVQKEEIKLIKQPQTSFVLIDSQTMDVKALVGGRGEKLAYNRAVEKTGDPGMVLSVLSTYLPALDTSGQSLGNVIEDTKSNGSFFSKEIIEPNYHGYVNLRTGIKKDYKNVAVETLDEVGIRTGFSYLQNLGITTTVEKEEDEAGNILSDIDYRIALGEMVQGVTNFQLTAAYATVAGGGVYRKPALYTRVEDLDGSVILEKDNTTDQVAKESSTWFLTDAMVGGIDDAIHLNSGDQRIAFSGKKGLNQAKDQAIVEGFTPYYTGGLIVGYDDSKSCEGEVQYVKLWKDLMTKIHEMAGCKTKEFASAKDVVSANICEKCGKLAVKGICDLAKGGSSIYKEYFVRGMAPVDKCDCHVKYLLCDETGELASEQCPRDKCHYGVYLERKEESAEEEDDSEKQWKLPADKMKLCEKHSEK